VSTAIKPGVPGVNVVNQPDFLFDPADGGLVISGLAVSASVSISSQVNVNQKGTVAVSGSMVGGVVPVAFGYPGTADVFGQVVVSNRLPQYQAQFFSQPPQSYLNVSSSAGASATQGTGQAVFATTVTPGSQVKGVTFVSCSYAAGYEVYSDFTVAFSAGVAGTYQRIGLYDAVNGFALGFNGTSFGVWSRTSGVDTFVAQAAFNGDALTGNSSSSFTRGGAPEALNPLVTNVFRIRFGWLGSAPVMFDVMAADGQFVTFHTLRYPNSQVLPSITNPNLPMTVDVNNQASPSALTVKCGCWVMGVSTQNVPATNITNIISGSNQTVNIPCLGLTTIGVSVAGTWTGSLVPELSIDNQTWFAGEFTTPLGALAASLGSNNNVFVTVGGTSQMRIRANGAWTGSATVSLVGSPNPSTIILGASLPNGGNAIGSVSATGGSFKVSQAGPIGVSSSLAGGLLVSGTVNSFPYGVVQANFSGTVGSLLPLTTTFQGFLQDAEQFSPVAEDNFNGVIAVSLLPTTASIYTPTVSGSVGALPGGTVPGVIKAGPGTLYRVFATNRNAAARYVTLHNLATGPTGVPIASYLIGGTAIDPGSTVIDFGPWGWAFTVGISIGISTSATSYSAATPTEHDVSCMYM
jgi:hypothetical protein